MTEVMTRDQAAYQRAADIANLLLGEGIPVLGFGAAGGQLSVRFQLSAASYTVLVPELDATPERFRELYEAVK